MIEDPFANASDSVMSPATDCFDISPDDTAELPVAPKALYIGIGGDIVLRSLNGSTDVTLRNVAPGTIIDVRPRAIRATGTTASNIVGLA